MRWPILTLAATLTATAPLHAEPVTWEQLVGKKITITLSQVRRVKVQEDGGTYTDRRSWQFDINPSANGGLRYLRKEVGTWTDWPGHDKPGGPPVSTVSTALSKVHQTPDGQGTAVWSLENGNLIRLSVETEGTKGRTFVIAFSDSAKDCQFKLNEVGQVGAGAKTWVNPQGQKRWLISLQSQSTSCRIS